MAASRMPPRAGLAQLVEHLICNQGARGSNPLAGTMIVFLAQGANQIVSIRASIRDYRPVAIGLLVMTLLVRVLVPAGFMLSSAPDTVFTITVCADSGGPAKAIQLKVPAKASHGGESAGTTSDDGTACAFSGLANLALMAADAALLALALAYILLRATAPVPLQVFGRNFHLRPPLRAPPLLG